MRKHAAALADERHARLRSARVKRFALGAITPVCQAIDVVDEPLAIRAHQRKASFARDPGDALLHAALAGFGEPGGENQRRADAAPHAGGNGVADSGRRKRQHGEIDALGQIIHAHDAVQTVDRIRRCG